MKKNKEIIDNTDELILSILESKENISAYGVHSFLRDKHTINLSRATIINRLLNLVEHGYVAYINEPENNPESTLFYIQTDDKNFEEN